MPRLLLCMGNSHIIFTWLLPKKGDQCFVVKTFNVKIIHVHIYSHACLTSCLISCELPNVLSMR